MADITQIFNQFKTEAEIKQFCEAQYRTILELSNKIKLLQEKNKNLEKLLVQGVPLEAKNETNKDKSNEEAICIVQIALLKGKSEEAELTLEESKKLDTYAKLLMSIRDKKPKKEESLEGFNETDLLKVIENDAKS